MPALREGTPVIQSTPIDDVERFDPPGGKDPILASPAGRELTHWQWTPALMPPTPAEATEAHARPVTVPMPVEQAPTWQSLLGLSDAEAFEAWCTGRTGAPLVDAGMAQLWVTGWMPRRVRLLCASCLVEGLGLDWRLGRDWFKYAEVDHDFAINECMWQNAGLVGCDPFYRGLKWEVVPVDGEADRSKEEPDFSAASKYVREWRDLQYKALGRPSALPPWPPPLHAALERPRPPVDAVTAVAVARRAFLKRAYQTGGRVSRVGVRIMEPEAGPTPAELTWGSYLGSHAMQAEPPPATVPASPLFCAVGHMRPRVPPIGGERSAWAPLNHQLLHGTSLGGKEARARGAGKAWARHSLAAREEAARKLIQNHAKVVSDVVNSAPATQRELGRLGAQARPHVEQALREVARRLLGCRGGIGSLREEVDPSGEGVDAWAGVAAYLCARVQTPSSPPPPSNPARAPDMGEEAAAAFCDVLREVGLEAERKSGRG